MRLVGLNKASKEARKFAVLGIPMLVVSNMCLILTVSYYLLLRTAEPQLGWGGARDKKQLRLLSARLGRG